MAETWQNTADHAPGTPPAPASRGWQNTSDHSPEQKSVGGFLRNLGSSAVDLAGNIGHAITNPLQTLDAIGSIPVGIYQKLGGPLPAAKPGEQDSAEMLDRLIDHFKERYGSLDAVKETLYKDPVGVLMDASMAFGGVGEAADAASVAADAAKLGKVAKVADTVSTAARTASRLTNPATPVIAGGKAAGSAVVRAAANSDAVTGAVNKIPTRAAETAGAIAGAKLGHMLTGSWAGALAGGEAGRRVGGAILDGLKAQLSKASDWEPQASYSWTPAEPEPPAPPRAEPGWKSIPESPATPAESAPVDTQPAALPSGRRPGGIANQQPTPAAAPDAPAPDPELLDGIAQWALRKPFAKLSPLERQRVLDLAQRGQAAQPVENRIPPEQRVHVWEPQPAAQAPPLAGRVPIQQPAPAAPGAPPAIAPPRPETGADFVMPDAHLTPETDLTPALKASLEKGNGTPANPFEARARDAKAQQMAKFLYAEGQGILHADALRMDPKQWQLAAQGAGVNAKTIPSPTTVQKALGFLKDLWSDESGTMRIGGGGPEWPSPEEVRSRALDLVKNDPEKLLAEYQSRYGNKLNTDDAAELFPEYKASLESRTRYRTAVNQAAQWIRDELFRRGLADPNVKNVVFTAGGTGAGKSSAGLTGDLVFDSTMSRPFHMNFVQQALDAGKNAHIVYTYRPIIEAFEGALERSKTQGRAVPIDMMIDSHDGAAKTVSTLYQRYADNPKVSFQFVDNTGAQPTEGTIALTQKENYRGSRKKLDAILESRRGEISNSVYETAKGSRSGGGGPAPGSAGNH